jgi:DNA-binding beta-propeller fold protein YncE
MALTTGTLLGSYRIVAPLGAGGMGEVYRARDTRLDRDVAIKILQDTLANDPDRLARFEREAKTLATLNHPHIAQIYGLEGLGHERALVMELVEGPTLAERLARGPLPIDEAIGIARQVAEALEAAHEAGVIHRDVKPANIKVRADGTVKVLDFGLAKAASHDAHPELANSPTFASPAMTAAGIILGTAAYMSPEQARGKPVDKRADIWAFGCVVYEMLTGQSPFRGETVTDVIAAVVRTDPDWSVLQAPVRLRALVKRCLQKDPHQRLRDIGDARLELAEPLAEDPANPAPTARRRSRGVLAAAALVVLAAGVAAGAIWQRARWSSQTPQQWTGTYLGGPAIALHPRISPDGQLLAFLTVVDGLTQVAVMKPDTGNWTLLTRDRTNGLSFTISWSSDSSRIYYDRYLDSPRGIYSVPALGGEERLVIESANSPEPLQDGSLLLLRINADRMPQLHRFWPSSGRLDPLPAVLPVSEAESQVRRLPDGRSVAFIGRPMVGDDRSAGLYEMDLESKQIRRLGEALPVPVAGFGVQPSLAVDPDDGSLFVAVADGALHRVFRVDRRGSAAPRSILMFPMQTAIDAGRGGALYVGFQERPVEILRLASASAGVERLAAGPSIGSTGIAPLADGRMLISSMAGDRLRVLVLSPGKEPVPLVDTEEDTRPPMTAVGDSHAALVIGSGETRDIAIVVAATGRIVERFPAPPRLTGLASSPDGKTLYVAAAGSISALPRGGGAAQVIGVGDSLTVDPQSGDLIVKLDEQERMRLARIPAGGGTAQPIPFHGAFGMIIRPLAPGAVRNNQLLLPLSSPDSWDWHAGVVDLKTGSVERLAADYATDFHFVTRAADGTPIGVGLGSQSTLWKFTPAPASSR